MRRYAVALACVAMLAPRVALCGDALAECARLFEEEIRDGIVHGAAVVAGGLDGRTLSGAWGWADAAHSVPMTTRTVVDVASVTKVAAGVSAYLVAHARGMVDFDVPFTNYLSAYAAPLSRSVTIRDLANHVSGFGEADGSPRVYFSHDAQAMLRNVLSMPPAEPIRGKVAYSCRNYILLGQAFESLTGTRVDEFCRREVFAPAGMTDSSLGSPPPSAEKGRLAQTMGTDGPGVVSDFVARPLWADGIGTFNAGLFTTAEDMAKLMRVYLRGGVCDNGTRLWGADEMAQIAPSPTNRVDGARSFGWQYAAHELPEELSGAALFHSGWSGQTVLFDLKRQRYAVVLTTRSGDYSRAKRDRFKAISALLDGCKGETGADERPRNRLGNSVVYQIALRTFTREGNFRAATEMLDHVKSVGVDVIYLTPFVEADRDMDRSGWSPRQKRFSGGSPKNPYRIANYDRIDPEYGGDADFKAFNDKAHALGLKVYMDLVYMHCGPNNVMKDLFPDAFQRNPDGSVRVTSFKFPYVNFKSKSVRQYLIDSMLRWVSLGCDGFRCDMADSVPLDFWEEAAAACRAVKPDLGMINEGWKPESLKRAFDACYALPWSYFIRDELVRSDFNKGFVKDFGADGKDLAWRMGYVRDYEAKLPKGGLTLCFLDNHDTAQDDVDSRFDRCLPVEAGNAGFTLMFLRRGVPLVFSGNEIADRALNTILLPVEHPARAGRTVDWARALQPAGRKRLVHIRALAHLRHTMPVFTDGLQEWVTGGEAKGAVAFVRRLGATAVFVAANLHGEAVAFSAGALRPAAGAKPLLSEHGELDADGVCRLGPYGHIVVPVVGELK